MMQSKNIKVMFALLGGAAVGATLAVLFSPDQGARTRGKLAKEIGSLKSNLLGKYAELAGAAEELSATVKKAKRS